MSRRAVTQTWLPYVGPRSVAEYALVPLYVSAQALANELLFRAYLVTRLRFLLGSGWKAAVVSALLFAALHAGLNVLTVLHSLIFGLMAGFTLLTLRSIVPSTVASAVIYLLRIVRHP